ncbi:MAG: hypothetical protein MJZ18_08135, partial [Bacteroidales bacterium]|nr:hypothetical protein [Bacteroidales bacterium]
INKIMTKHSKYFALLALLTTGAVCFTSCEDEDNEELMGNWVNARTSMGGSPRGGAVSFVIDNVAYIGTGANTLNPENRDRYTDFFSCKTVIPVVQAGEKKNGTIAYSAAGAIAPMPKYNKDGVVSSRNGAVAFSLNGKGYVGTGFNGVTYLKDFWEFDPKADFDASAYRNASEADKRSIETSASYPWKQVADYPGDTCRYAVAFVIPGTSKMSDGTISQNTKSGKDLAFVGTGEDCISIKKNDFYCFDGEKWEAVTSIGEPRAQAVAFVAEGYNAEGKLQMFGYVAGGMSSSPVIGFQRYNALTNEWEHLNDLADQTIGSFDDDYRNLAISGSTGFVVNGRDPYSQRAYLATGGPNTYGTYCWEYNPYKDYWIQKSSFEGAPRRFAVSFVLQFPNPWHEGEMMDIPFVTGGTTGSLNAVGVEGTFFDDTWYLRPYESREPLD